jgi:exosome complex component RRP42
MKGYTYEAELVKQSILENKRVSKRGLLDTREITMELNTLQNADGSCILTYGKTKVIAGVKVLVDKPYPDTPDEGSISVGIELSPMSDPDFGTGPPDETSIELSRVVDRSIRESKGIDFKTLCIVPGKFIWVAFVDIYIVNNDGNLFDACELASLAAIKCARLPKIELTEDTCKIVKGEYDGSLKISNDPVLFTFAKIEDKIVLDPELVEESASSSRFSIAITNDKKIVAIQKGELGSFKIDEIKFMVNYAIKYYDTMISKFEKAYKLASKK